MISASWNLSSVHCICSHALFKFDETSEDHVTVSSEHALSLYEPETSVIREASHVRTDASSLVPNQWKRLSRAPY